MISVEGLTRYVDSSQLTRDLGGSLLYDHDEWLETRMVISHLLLYFSVKNENLIPFCMKIYLI